MSGRKRLNDADRVELMLCVLPWIVSRQGATLTEIGEHFGADPEMIRRDLQKVFVDLEFGDPYTMVEVDITDDGWVEVRLPGSFEDPPNLDHSEALHLLASGTAMAAVEGASEALDPALDKLVSVLGEGARGAIRVDLGGGDPSIRELLRMATRQRCRVKLRYFSWGSDTVADRTVDPYMLRSVRGEWYLTGHCHDRDAVRHSRLDRILAAETVGAADAFEEPDDLSAPLADFSTEAREVQLRVPVSAAWVVDSLPLSQWSESDDGNWVEVRFGVSSDTWLERVLVRLPPESEATDLGEGTDLMAMRSEAARRIIERHTSSDEVHQGTGRPPAGQ